MVLDITRTDELAAVVLRGACHAPLHDGNLHLKELVRVGAVLLDAPAHDDAPTGDDTGLRVRQTDRTDEARLKLYLRLRLDHRHVVALRKV